jgi:hypothetical protein
MATKKGASKKVQDATVHTSMLTPAARKRKELEEAKNVDATGMRRIPGDTVIDRDGRQWTVQAQHRTSGRYTISPVRLPEYGDMGYVHRSVTDQQLDQRDFGFRKGIQLRQVDGEMVDVPSDFT